MFKFSVYAVEWFMGFCPVAWQKPSTQVSAKLQILAQRVKKLLTQVDLFCCLQYIHAAHVHWCTLEHQLPVLLTMFPGKERIFEQFLTRHILKLLLHVWLIFIPLVVLKKLQYMAVVKRVCKESMPAAQEELKNTPGYHGKREVAMLRNIFVSVNYTGHSLVQVQWNTRDFFCCCIYMLGHVVCIVF